jgi:arylsulfatase
MAGSAGKLYDLLMNNLTERPWMAKSMGVELKKLMGTFVKYPPRNLRSLGYRGPIMISEYQRLEWLRDQMKKEGVNLSLPTGN